MIRAHNIYRSMACNLRRDILLIKICYLGLRTTIYIRRAK